jgi:hypothetical protein
MTIHHELYKKFYSENEKPKLDEMVTSSHWKEYSKKINVRRVLENDTEKYILNGYGFGENQKSTLISTFFTYINELVNLKKLKSHRLGYDIKKCKKIIKNMGLVYSQDAFRQICTLNLLKEKTGNQASIKNILIIGDGYGILSGLLHDAYPSARIFLIDLGPMLFFQSYYLNNLFPEADQFLIGAEDNPNGGGYLISVVQKI